MQLNKNKRNVSDFCILLYARQKTKKQKNVRNKKYTEYDMCVVSKPSKNSKIMCNGKFRNIWVICIFWTCEWKNTLIKVYLCVSVWIIDKQEAQNGALCILEGRLTYLTAEEK